MVVDVVASISDAVEGVEAPVNPKPQTPNPKP